jgi:acid stress chaperone HdeB
MTYRTGGFLGLTLAVIVASASHAQVTIDIAKITCGQFLAYSIADPKDIALWLNGYYTGRRGGSTLIEPEMLKANYGRIRSHCLVNQDMTVMHAIEALFSDRK